MKKIIAVSQALIPILVCFVLTIKNPYAQISAEVSIPPTSLPTALNAEAPSRPGLSGRLFAFVRPAVVQIKTSLGPFQPKASYGSGFAVSSDGLVVTNFHVVATALYDEDDRYQIYVINHKGGVFKAQVLAIDVIRDLAVLKVETTFSTFLSLEKKKLLKGEKIFSMGLPKDINIVITEGTYNGAIRYGIYEKLHMSSPINSGMSGGPTINKQGKVIGVNVSILLNSQNISFSVPVRHVEALLQQKNRKVEVKKNLQSLIGEQLNQVQESLIKEMMQTSVMRHPLPSGELLTGPIPSQSLDNWTFRPPSSSLKCWSHYRNKPKSTFTLTKQVCELMASSYIGDRLHSGNYFLSYLSLRNKGRNPFQYFHLLNALYNDAEDEILSRNNDQSRGEVLTRASCSYQIVNNSHLMPFRLNYCLRAYISYPSLYILDFKAVTLNPFGESLILKAGFKGISADNIKKVIEFHLEGIERKIL